MGQQSISQKKLLRCPFCGERATIDALEITCMSCHAVLFFGDDITQMINGWNRRTPGPATKAMLEWAKALQKTQSETTWHRLVEEVPRLLDSFINEWK